MVWEPFRPGASGQAEGYERRDLTEPRRDGGWRAQLPTFTPETAVFAAGVIGLSAMWFGGDGRRLGFPLDDSWIHMVYGRSLAEEGLLAFNRGVPATGSTSPLWAGLLAIAHLLGGGDGDRTVVIVYLMGAGLHLTGLLLLARLVLELTGSRGAAAIAGGLGACSGPLAFAAFSGMEVALTAALVLAAVLASVRHAWGLAGLWLALGALARPEAVAVSLACFVFAGWATQHAVVRERVRVLTRLTWPSVVLGGLIVAHALRATGRALPATFYMKQNGSLGELGDRVLVAFAGLLGDVPPLETAICWLALAGLVIPGRIRSPGPRGALFLPVLAALGFVLANTLLIAPVPDVFYHLRYLLPAVPLLIAGIVVGAFELGRIGTYARSPRLAHVPVLIVLGLGAMQGVATAGPDSRRLHNDIRNIHEVQRALGEWIAAHTEPGTWIATGDAGAVRYFGDRPTIDVMGLNTPEFYWTPGWTEARPIAAFVMLPCWFHPRPPPELHVVATARTERYTVTTNPCMEVQVVVTCTGEATVPLAFVGVRSFTLSCRPGVLRAGPQP
jgi:hypothetical protein